MRERCERRVAEVAERELVAQHAEHRNEPEPKTLGARAGAQRRLLQLTPIAPSRRDPPPARREPPGHILHKLPDRREQSTRDVGIFETLIVHRPSLEHTRWVA